MRIGQGVGVFAPVVFVRPDAFGGACTCLFGAMQPVGRTPRGAEMAVPKPGGCGCCADVEESGGAPLTVGLALCAGGFFCDSEPPVLSCASPPAMVLGIADGIGSTPGLPRSTPKPGSAVFAEPVPRAVESESGIAAATTEDDAGGGFVSKLPNCSCLPPAGLPS